jgi:Phosphopantetheine attachment site
VGIHDHFFALGGHSLQATQVIARARRIFEVDIPVRALFDAPTVAELAVVIAQSFAPSTPQELERLLSEVEGLSAEDMQRYFTTDSRSADREEGEI